MDQKTIELTLQFMERVQLNGKEVPAFNTCVQALLAAREEVKQAQEVVKEALNTEED